MPSCEKSAACPEDSGDEQEGLQRFSVLYQGMTAAEVLESVGPPDGMDVSRSVSKASFDYIYHVPGKARVTLSFFRGLYDAKYEGRDVARRALSMKRLGARLGYKERKHDAAGFSKLRPGMRYDTVCSIVGIPNRAAPTGVERYQYDLADGSRFNLTYGWEDGLTAAFRTSGRGEILDVLLLMNTAGEAPPWSSRPVPSGTGRLGKLRFGVSFAAMCVAVGIPKRLDQSGDRAEAYEYDAAEGEIVRVVFRSLDRVVSAYAARPGKYRKALPGFPVP